jgi:hypothetical protein
MSLLKALGLPPLPAMKSAVIAQRAAPKHPTPVDPDTRKVRASIALQRQKARDTLVKLNGIAPALEQKIAAAKGEEKKKLNAAQAEFEKKKAEAVHAIEQADADLQALGNPATRREELVKILVRHRSGGSRATEIEVDTAGLQAPTARNHDVTTTTTAYGGGKAVVDKVRDQRQLGLAGSTSTQSRDTQEHSASGVVRTSTEKKTHISSTGKYRHDEKKSIEVQTHDGKAAKLEQGQSTQISAQGGSRTTTTARENADGSSSSTIKTIGAERGEGKAGVSADASATKTDASGHAVTTSAKGGGGMMAGKDGYGAYAGGQGGMTSKNKDGVHKGAVVGLDANISCNIGDPTGQPPKYPLTLKVNLGADITLSAGRSKEGGSSFGVSVKAGATVFMNETRMLNEAQAADYLKALQAASAGGTVPATYKELKIVSAGVKQGWAVAQQMWKSGGKPISKEMIAALKNVGDSSEVGGSETKGVAINANVKGIGVELGTTETTDHSTKLTRNEQGTLDVNTNAGRTKQDSAKVSFNPGPVGVEVGAVHTVRTTLAFDIVIDPQNDPDGKLFAELGRCKSDKDYEGFVAKYKGRITVVARTDGKAADDRTSTGVSLGGAKASIFTHQGVAEQKKVDGKGRLIQSRTVGTAGAGGQLGPLADSVEDEATAEREGSGNASLRLEQTRNDKDYGKMLKNKVRKLPGGSHIVGQDKKEAKGALTKAAGGEEDDTATKDVMGIRLSIKDLKRIGQIACTDRGRWNRAPRRYQENKDWAEAGNAIVRAKGDPGVVADELAKFVGGDRVERLNTLQLFVRGGNATNVGSAYEFPDSLKSLRADYERYIEAPFEPDLEKLAAVDTSSAVGLASSLSVTVEALYTKFYQAHDFSKPALQAEMLGAITSRRNALADAIRKYAGKASADDERKETQAKVKRMIEHCFDFSGAEKKLFDELDDLLSGYENFRSADGKEVKDYLRQLKDLRTRWRENYDEAVKLAKSIGMKQNSWDQDILRPNDAQYQKFFKAAERVGMV